MCWRKWTSTPSCSASPSSCWWTSWPTPTLPGSRHPKRYLDVEELLGAGIDVYTTLNMQHVESLNDVVAKITHVRVRETVPDSILDRADDIEVIDLTPEDLLQRLKDGKVYIADAAERAARNYFAPGNLAALRELALRRTAQRVDEQMRRLHACPRHPGALGGERTRAGVGDRKAERAALIRYGRRMADRIHASWTAIYVETSQSLRMSEAERDRVADALRTAERLGGQSVTVPAATVADGVIDYAYANNFTHIVASTRQLPRWQEFFEGSAAHEIIRRARDISVHVVPEPRGPALGPSQPRFFLHPILSGGLSLGAYGGASRSFWRRSSSVFCCATSSASPTPHRLWCS